MIRYAVVGTGPISRQFVNAATDQGSWRLRGVLGSSHAHGQEFLSSFHVVPADAVAHGRLAELAISRDCDVVYVASPNSLHFSVACEALAHGKHVIVEKPAFSTLQEWMKAHEIADSRGVLLLEAARHIYEDNYQILSSAVSELGGAAPVLVSLRGPPDPNAGQRPAEGLAQELGTTTTLLHGLVAIAIPWMNSHLPGPEDPWV